MEGESISPLDTLGWRKLLDNQTDKWNGQLVGVPEGAETLAGGGVIHLKVMPKNITKQQGDSVMPSS